MDILGYDKLKMKEDTEALTNIVDELKEDVEYLFKQGSSSGLLDSLGIKSDCLDSEYKRLVGIYTELEYIVNCIDKSRDRYERCEDKVGELLDRVKLNIM